MEPKPYPKPGNQGGHLIRQVIRALKKGGFELPIASHILIATSGGSDSLALAHLLTHYGRRAVDPAKILLLHVNHGWRGAASDADADFVAKLAKDWEMPLILHRLKAPTDEQMDGASWEAQAREARKSIFASEALQHSAIVMTAHQADDLAETLLWRLFTGAAQSHGGGISSRHGVEFRPLLRIRKSQLQAYLVEEGQVWREDATNSEGRFLRSKMRQSLMPLIESQFPRAVEHLVDLALQTQVSEKQKSGLKESSFEALSTLFGASGTQMRRAHWAALRDRLDQGAQASLTLPGGWRLSQEASTDGTGIPKRWVLETLD